MKQFTKDKIDELISDLRRITKKTNRIYLRECYIESLLETSGFHYEYKNFVRRKKDKVGSYEIWYSQTMIMFQYQCKKRTFTKCICITKK